MAPASRRGTPLNAAKFMATEWLRFPVQSWTHLSENGRTPPEARRSQRRFQAMRWQPFRGFRQRFECVLAEREGFEPSEPRKGFNGFRDRPVQPLRHLSGAVFTRLTRL